MKQVCIHLVDAIHADSNENAGNPVDPVADFFDNYSLQGAKEILWEQLKGCLCSQNADNWLDRDKFICLTENLGMLLNAVYANHQKAAH